MKTPAVSALPVPDERRPAVVAATAAAVAGAVVTGATIVSWRAVESRAALALIVSVLVLAVACGALGGYLVWLRRAVTARMAGLLRPYAVEA